ncbi:MAG: PIG-L family deacetylase [Gelidibacter sp.]
MIKNSRQAQERLYAAPLLAIEQLGMQLGNSLILTPHPDDEALGCGGMISYLRSQNIPVTIIFITSGGASHPNSLQYPPAVLASLREKEALQSCEILGVNSEDVIFYRKHDGALENLEHEEMDAITEKLSLFISDRDISTIFMPWRRDGHRDHKVTHMIGFESVQKCNHPIQIVEYPIWLWKSSEVEDWPIEDELLPFRLNVEAVLSQKREAIFAHKSQTTSLINDDPEGFILTDDLLSPFLGSYEFYFFSKDRKMNSLDQKFFDTLYSENVDPWNFKHSNYELSKYQKTDEILGNKKFKKGLELGCSIGIQTRFFAKHCDELVALDISRDAIKEAQKNNGDLHNVDFLMQNIVEEFPRGPFDFISMCEIGYYFDQATLLEIFKKISENISENGQFLMVHWSSFVREFPLNGNQVNAIFKKFNSIENRFTLITSYYHDRYELHLWEKQMV